MKKQARLHIPFSQWAMAIDHPYSLGVLDGASFWSCGQCPLDRNSKTKFPGDLPAQVRFTAEQIRSEFAQAGVRPETIGKLVLYYVDGGEALLDAAIGAAREVLGATPLIVPVGVPYFYYDGMLTEIDVYGGNALATDFLTGEIGNARFRTVQSGPFRHVAVDVNGASAENALSEYRSKPFASGLRSALQTIGADLAGLLSARLFLSRSGNPQAVDPMQERSPLCPDPGTIILADLPDGVALTADLVFAADPADGRDVYGELVDGVCLSAVLRGQSLCVQGRVDASLSSLPMPEQTLRIMEGFSALLSDRGFAFADVVKQQAHYVGSASPEALYANMRVRNGYFSKPGPASTGLPVHGFVAEGTAISIELLAVN